MSPSQQPDSSAPSLLAHISNETACSSYLAELVSELPLASSQFGIVLSTALGNRENPSNVRPKRPGQDTALESGFEEPHYRAIPIPVEDTSTTTEMDVTLSGHATTFYARCEDLLMRAAVRAADTADTADGGSDADKATAGNFARALVTKPVDPIVQGHCRNVLTVISNILEHQAAKRARLGKEENVLDVFFCVNDIWRQPLESLPGKLIRIGNRAVKFVISEEELLKQESEVQQRCQQLEQKQGLVLESMKESDVQLMITLNKVSYSEEYGKHIIRHSRCFRDKDGNMVAWAGTHGDFSIAALHVMPEYRKMGLGRLVLNALALVHVRLAHEILTTLGGKSNGDISPSTLYAHADCLEDNLPTMLFMERCGWRRIGNYLWLGMYNKDAPEPVWK
ncbi:hypothetical protein BGZ54_004959 [Gamsiella multidivaricata]|nr:hypothetical protein BGZ54_004959 [Gamsiella multidivaricata]